MNRKIVITFIFIGLFSAFVAPAFAARRAPSMTVAITSPAPSATVSGTITLSASVTGNAGTVRVLFFVDNKLIGSDNTVPYNAEWDTTTAANGSHSIKAKIMFTSIEQTIQVNVNNAPPSQMTLALLSPTAGQQVTGDFQIQASVAGNVGTTTVVFYVDQIDPNHVIGSDYTSLYTTTWRTAQFSNGSHTIIANARDEANNTASASITANVQNAPPADTTPPSVAITSPLNGATISGAVTISANASDNVEISKVEFYDGASKIGEDATVPYSMSWNTSGLSGSHALTAKAFDTATPSNSTTSAAVSVSITPPPDTTLPTAFITSPTDGTTVSGLVTVSANASDNVGVVSVELLVDGSIVGSPDASAPYSFTWNSASVSNGLHSLSVRARDAAGNAGLSASVSVNTQQPDTASPIASVTSPVAGSTVSGNVTVNATASDNVGVTSVELLVNGNLVGTPDASAPYSFIWNSASVADGSYALSVRARDAAGNAGTSPSVSINVLQPGDTTPPTVSITGPVSGAKLTGNVTVAVNASDNVGVTKVEFLVDGNVRSTKLSSPYTWLWDTTAEIGNHTLSAKAYDTVTSALSASVSVQVIAYKTVKSYVHFGSPGIVNTQKDTACFQIKYNDFIAGKKSTSASDILNTYKSFNPDALVVMYQNGIGAEPDDSYNNYYEILVANNMIWKDVNGNYLKVGNHYVVNYVNSSVQQQWANLLTTSSDALLYAAHNDGFFMDSLGGGASPTVFGSVMPANWDPSVFYTAKDTTLRTIKRAFPNEKIYFNGFADWSVLRGEPQWTGLLMLEGTDAPDGIILEGFSYAGSHGSYTGMSESRLRIRFDAAKQVLNTLQKGMVMIDYVNPNDYASHIFPLANYLLVANERSFYGPLLDGIGWTQSADLPEYYVDLGMYLDNTFSEDGTRPGLLKRAYQGGVVYSNIKDSTTYNNIPLSCTTCQKMVLSGGGLLVVNGNGVCDELPQGRVTWQDISGTTINLAPKEAAIIRQKP